MGGLIPYKERRRNAYQVGVVYGQRSQLWWDLPLVDSFDILAAMYRVSRPDYRGRLDFLVALFEMGDFLEQPVRRLSLGQRMRGEVAASLLHEPPILYLDEPTIGLDVLSRNRLLQHIRDLNRERQTTVILTTHNQADVERVCPRIVIIGRGFSCSIHPNRRFTPPSPASASSSSNSRTKLPILGLSLDTVRSTRVVSRLPLARERPVPGKGCAHLVPGRAPEPAAPLA